MSEAFYGEANRFAYFFSLPLLIFTGTVKSGLTGLSVVSVLSVVLPTLFVFFLALGIGLALRLRNGRLGSFVQTAYHGNVSYVGLSVVFYLLGEKGLEQASLLIGFLILTTNGLSTMILSLTSESGRSGHPLRHLVALGRNPVIISSLAGLLVLFLKVPVPGVILKSMSILANIALPLALITIGASLTTEGLKKSLALTLLSSVIKLLVLPCCGILYLIAFGLPVREHAASILLLATPVASLSYIMAQAMGGDGEMASSSVTFTTLVSALTYVFWVFFLNYLLPLLYPLSLSFLT